MSEETAPTASPRQLKLFHLESPLTLRFGSEFFRTLPQSPGVYFFYDGEGQLLYIGQSSDLRARIGSYRHVTPERHPKRTLRLVSQVAVIDVQTCNTAAEAVELERILLLAHRPPFNRAGVWLGDPWWLSMNVEVGGLTLSLQREASPGGLGPLPRASRHLMGTIVRNLLRIANPTWKLSDFPSGLMAPALPLECRIPASCPSELVQMLTAALAGDVEGLLANLRTLPPPVTLTEQEFWQEELERLEKLKTPRPSEVSFLRPRQMSDEQLG
ncbi:MAG: GIY-YIG nuclease family protein [Prosthecobacter sp.]|uniref:GIY-YIG nuclease family protein n=1 Tax=Prosthecobacter sp. TaxID=1965333 RepID=UPI0025D0A60B|nr:GIY-YIG nuclease family protein [Prosthecobacter sp.]MCF7786765.1 GIY-YIG nuclease family protein [Prosthecobacter sp.]